MPVEKWLVVKRDLYWRPGDSGYTGIRDHAARYTYDEAKSRVGDGSSGCSMVKESDAPEFTNACFDDLARDHLTKQRNDLRAVLEAYEAWEADLILNNSWSGAEGLPTLTRPQYERMMQIQAMRNDALGR